MTEQTVQELESESSKLFYARERMQNDIVQINQRLSQIAQLLSEKLKDEPKTI